MNFSGDDWRVKGNAVLTRYDYHKNVLKREVNTIKTITIPTQGYSINHTDLAEWFIEEFSPKELEQLLNDIKLVKKRTNNIKPFLATIAVGMLSKAE
ncbi:hypothetical protein ACFYKT_09245 [Cytobacillus sp. FJAT-53684]|uniref:Uncharacterized protein n=1 Tax=Cytobacillus mangrovibacter TaxID=3299024 RepID=A0ABW6JX97_9BACI